MILLIVSTVTILILKFLKKKFPRLMRTKRFMFSKSAVTSKSKS